MTTMRVLIGLAAAWAIGTSVPAEANDDKSRVELKTDKVVVFKDGYCLFIRSGTAVCDEQGEVYVNDLPDAAVLGSFWATADSGPPTAMRAGWHTVTNGADASAPCTQPVEILKANEGKTCTVQLHDKTTYTGTIRQVLATPAITAVEPAGLAGLGLRRHFAVTPGGSLSVSGIQATHFVLAADEGDLLLPAASILTLKIREMQTDITRTVTQSVREKRLTLRFDRPGARRRISLMYFRPGMRWIPTYRVSLTSGKDKLADIRLQAEILNEAEDLVNVPVDIVVGVPNFRFRTVVSPLVLESALRDTLRQAAPQIMGQFSNALFTQRAREHARDVNAAETATGGGGIAVPEELAGGGSHDLFVYHLPELRLGRGERAAVQVFAGRVPYRDVYTWEMHVKRHDIATAPSGSDVQSPLALSRNEVWHQIELNNVSELPWTTGAVMIMDGQQPLAQELLTYTSPRGVVRVPVTVSVDTRGSFTEEETGRQLKALTWDGYHYARLTNAATPTLVNRKDVPIDAEITLRFGGKADEVTPDGKITINPYSSQDWENYRGNPAVNNSSSVTWAARIEPEDAFAGKVTYHYFARH